MDGYKPVKCRVQNRQNTTHPAPATAGRNWQDYASNSLNGYKSYSSLLPGVCFP